MGHESFTQFRRNPEQKPRAAKRKSCMVPDKAGVGILRANAKNCAFFQLPAQAFLFYSKVARNQMSLSRKLASGWAASVSDSAPLRSQLTRSKRKRS